MQELKPIPSKHEIVEYCDPTRTDEPENRIWLHRQRYEFGINYMDKCGRTLDLGCGVGYGTAMIAQHTKLPVVGVDRSYQALSVARKAYCPDNVVYIRGDAHLFHSPHRFANIFTLEVLEHLEDPNGVQARVYDMLGDHGLWVVSVPINEVPGDNKYHLWQPREQQFRTWLHYNFMFVAGFLQGSANFTAVVRKKMAIPFTDLTDEGVSL